VAGAGEAECCFFPAGRGEASEKTVLKSNGRERVQRTEARSSW